MAFNTQAACDRMKLAQSSKELTTFFLDGPAFKQGVLNRFRLAVETTRRPSLQTRR